MKGAVTNALGGAWFFGGWQISVYMGKRGHDQLEGTAEEERPAPKKGKAKAAKADEFLEGTEPSEPAPKPEPEAKQEPAPEVDPDNASRPGADYVVPFGPKKGIKLGAIPDEKIAGALEWAKKNKPVVMAEFIEAATAYLKHDELEGAFGPKVPVEQQEVNPGAKVLENLSRSLREVKTGKDLNFVVAAIRESFEAKRINPAQLDRLYEIATEVSAGLRAKVKA
jgi:hypothetical protein